MSAERRRSWRSPERIPNGSGAALDLRSATFRDRGGRLQAVLLTPTVQVVVLASLQALHRGSGRKGSQRRTKENGGQRTWPLIMTWCPDKGAVNTRESRQLRQRPHSHARSLPNHGPGTTIEHRSAPPHASRAIGLAHWNSTAAQPRAPATLASAANRSLRLQNPDQPEQGPQLRQPARGAAVPDRSRNARDPAQRTGSDLRVWWWQVLGSNQHRLSRRFHSEPIPAHVIAADLRFLPSSPRENRILSVWRP